MRIITVMYLSIAIAMVAKAVKVVMVNVMVVKAVRVVPVRYFWDKTILSSIFTQSTALLSYQTCCSY